MARRGTGYRGCPGAAIAGCIAMLLSGPAVAEEAGIRLQGVFCNTEGQIDAALHAMGEGLSPGAAVETVNRDAVHCTHADLLEFVVDRPVAVGVRAPFVKHRGRLVGVVVGGRLMRVSPPAEVYFVTPDPPAGAVAERRV